jgi:hypothetical protein
MIKHIEPGCEFCDKRGLPLLIARYALAPAAAGAPKTRVFDTGSSKPLLAPDPKLAHYTRRLLRPGYLYVYDEKRQRWQGYFVNQDAYLMQFDPSKPMPPSFTLRL